MPRRGTRLASVMVGWETSFLPPAEEVTDTKYIGKECKVPTGTGLFLKILRIFGELPIANWNWKIVMQRCGIGEVLKRTVVPEEPLFNPTPFSACEREPGTTAIEAGSDAAARVQKVVDAISDFHVSKDKHYGKRVTIRDLHIAYMKGDINPGDIANTIVKNLEVLENQNKWFISWDRDDILRQAIESASRYASGSPLSDLDGVPFCVKDHIDALPYSTTSGTAYLADMRPVVGDALGVAALKSLGGILIGKANMHEAGLGSTGVNTIWGTPANPWGEFRFTGGSSSGSAAIVGAGLCPISIGSDAGGSIRNPAAWCGCVGLLPTQGRVSEVNAVSYAPSLSQLGPITGCVEDAIILYSILADGCNPDCPSLRIPQLTIEPQPLNGLRMGVFWDWFNDADRDVVDACKTALHVMEDLGARIQEVRIPELTMSHFAHTVVIGAETISSIGSAAKSRKMRWKMNDDIALSILSSTIVSSEDYIQTQRIRQRLAKHFQKVLKDVDFLVTPTQCSTAFKYHPEVLNGESNIARSFNSMRFTCFANMLGIPALSIPVGKCSEEMPIGLQLTGKHWNEATLLRAAYHLERRLADKGIWSPNPPNSVNSFNK